MSEMTATRMSGRAATLLALAAAWSVAAFFLWDSTAVPGNLHLPSLSPRDYFSAQLLHRVGDFARFERIDWLLSQIALLVTFGIYARRGAAFARESAAGPIGTGMLLGMLGFAILWLVELPFRIADFWWQRRYHLAHGSYFEFVFANWLQLGGIFLSLCLALAIVMGLARRLGRWWWIPGGAVFTGIFALFVFVAPYLTSLDRAAPKLAGEAHAIAVREGVGDVPFRIQKVSKLTDAVNAYTFGLGPSRRVVLWDTFLTNDYPDAEVRFVIAHEYGHQARGHLWKGIVWYALFALPGAFLIERLTRRRGGMREPAAVPLALLVLVVLQLLALPLQNAISRHQEEEADWMALRTTRTPDAARALFVAFTRDDLAEPRPPEWYYLLLADHPPVLQRIAMAEAFRAR
jgi:STE24 endopeptidase